MLEGLLVVLGRGWELMGWTYSKFEPSFLGWEEGSGGGVEREDWGVVAAV